MKKTAMILLLEQLLNNCFKQFTKRDNKTARAIFNNVVKFLKNGGYNVIYCNNRITVKF